MKDLFQIIDSFNSPVNLLRKYHYLRKGALIFSLSMIPVWFIFGFDSGIGQFEEALKALVAGKDAITAFHSIYGMSFHFSSYVIYGFLFVLMSVHLERVGIKRSKNVVYSLFFTLFNIGLFEMWYMASFAYFQMNRNILEWFITDFWESPVTANFCFILLGLMTFIYFMSESYDETEPEYARRKFRFRFSMEPLIVITFTFFCILLWIYFPLPVATLTIGEWTSSNLFPQTHYAYMLSSVHLPNDALHFVNVLVKAFFAFSQSYIFARFEE